MNSPLNGLQHPRNLTNAMAGVLLTALVLLSGQVVADDATIVEAKILPAAGERQFQIHVTIRHADTGWDHYANRWDVLDAEGNLLGSRTLHHPHVNEQPFTRSLTVSIPVGVTRITIVASDSVHGDNEETYQLDVPDA
jgi:hypothetical protein